MNKVRSNEGSLETPFGVVLRTWREFRGLSITELAARAELHKGHVSEIEKGKIERPNRETLQKLAHGLGITEWDLHTRQLPDVDRAARGGFAFASPVRPRGRTRVETEQLQRLSRLVDELRETVDALLEERSDNRERG